MRRFLLCVVLSIGLASCTKPSDVPAEQVLQKAARASQELKSARFALTSAFVSKQEDRTVDMDITMKGVLQDGGKQTQLNVSFDGSMTEGKIRYDAKGNMDIIVAWNSDVYLQLHALTVKPDYPLFQRSAMERFMGKWWSIPGESAAGASATVTPDPRLLRTQSEVVRVVKDHGIEDINGHEAYHYDVVVDPDKLQTFLKEVGNERGESFDAAQMKATLSSLNATGELWIDTQTFYVHRILWHVPVTQDGALSGELQVELRDHDAAPPVAPPQTFEVFSPLMLLDDSSFLQEIETDLPVQEDLDEDDLQPLPQMDETGGWFGEDATEEDSLPPASDYPQAP